MFRGRMMQLFTDKNRNRFFISHLLTSIIVIGVFLAIVFFVWYPAPLASALGVIPVILMMVAIDVFVGPIFGFLVYKTGKKTLKMDLAIIILIQIIAFCYGAYSISQSRPAWMVHHAIVFSLVRHVDADYTGAELPEYRSSSWTGPRFVGYTETPKNITELFNKNIALRKGDMYSPLNYGEIKFSELPNFSLATLEKYNDKQKLDNVLKKYPNADSWVGMVIGGRQDLVVLVDSKNQKIVKIVDLRPWK